MAIHAYSGEGSWSTGDAITQEKMNNIEGGIALAHEGLALRFTKDEVNSLLSSVNAEIAGVRTTAQNAAELANAADAKTQDGRDAWTYVLQAMHYNAETESFDVTLQSRFLAVENIAGNASTAAQEAKTWITNAAQVGTVIENGRPVTASSLAQKIAYMDQLITAATSTASDVNTLINNNNVVARLTALDANADLTEEPYLMSVPDLILEVKGARGKNKTGGDNASLDARLDFIDGGGNAPARTLPSIITEVNDAHRTSDDTLDARFDSIDGGTAPTRTLPDVISEVNGAHRGAVSGDTLNQRFGAAESSISDINAKLGYNDLSNVETIQKKVNDAVTGLENRIDAIDNASTGTVAGLEDRISAAETDIATIAGELSMYDVAENIQNNNTRIDTIEENVVAMAKEIGMLQDEASVVDLSTAVSRTNTRVDEIASDLDTAESAIETLEDTLGSGFDTTTNTVAAKIAAAQAAAESTAAADATSKANAAEAAAKSYADTQLATKANASTVTTLQGEVDTLKDKDTIVVSKVGNTSNYTNNVPNIPVAEIKVNADYLIEDDNGKYFYWRYINSTWEMISGGGSGSGSGNNNAAYYATTEAFEAAEKDTNKDYYVLEDNIIHHYRYLSTDASAEPIEIGEITDKGNIKKYNIDKTVEEEVREGQTVNVNYLNLYEFDYGDNNITFDNTLATRIAHIELPEGGGGSASAAVNRVIRITPASVTTVQNEDKIYLRFFYSSADATGEVHEGEYSLKYNNGSVIASGTLNSGAADQTVTPGVWPEAPRPIGFYEIDVTDYCHLGTQTFNLFVTPSGQTNAIPRTWTIEIKELRLESSAPDSQLIEVGNTIQFPYTPYGAMSKTLYVKVDGTTIMTRELGSAISGTEQEVTIPAQTHGPHTISIYLVGTLNGEELPPTTAITRDYIWYDVNNDQVPIIIASPYRGVPITIEQYGELEIPYTIYNSAGGTSTVEYYEGNTLIDTVNITSDGVLTHIFDESGSKTLTIKVEETTLTFNITVTEMNIDIAQVTGAAINFDPATLTNTSVNRLPSWTYNNQTYHMTVSDNFNWSEDASGGGYKEDADGKCFVIKAGTWAEFDYKMFKQAVDNTDPQNPIFTSAVFNNGVEMKVTFKVSAVRDASAVWFTNVGHPTPTSEMPIGIQLSAHQGWLKTSEADAAEQQAQIEGTTASTNSYLYFPYSEEDKIELDININRSGDGENFMMSYEDGVPSKAHAYSTSDILYHTSGDESVIRIGSPDCDVYIYRLRIYDKALTTSEILRNFIADGKNIAEKVNRYERNSIYYDSTKAEGQRFTPYKTGSAVLDPQQLAKQLPNVKILMLETPTFTTDKKNFVKSSLRCIQAEGGKYYPARPNEDNWLFVDGYHSGQGTTSDKYGQSARNVDFLFMCDGTHAPTKKKNITGYTGYQSKLYKGETASVFNPTTKSWGPAVGATADTCVDWMGDECKVTLTSNSVPNNYFNLKVNVASSENVNNALLQKRYNDFLPYVYESPAYKRDHKIKNDMEFVPAILFIRETDPTIENHLEFGDNEWHFYALGNIGDSKKTDYTRAYDPDDMNEFTVEISDNNTHNSQFQSGVYMSNNERVVETSDSSINSMNYIWGITDEEWNAQRDPTEAEIDHDYRVANEIEYYADGETKVEDLFPYILPNGKVYVNYRHRMLSAEPFDGKHSFEFRYACKGDYRDGDLINETSGGDDDAQFELNRGVVEAFYEWIIRASNEEFENELSEWCVPEAVEFFYAYTHFYTMMDNRAKNCFWHFAKTGTHRQVHHTYPQLLHVYDELVNGEYVRTQDTEINPAKTYYTEYAFDLWVYDTDTALGIDNNGELIFPYGKEDTDYREANVSTSGYVFNGAGSIIWRRLSTTFTDDIADIFNTVNEAACFEAANLINEFDKFQSCFPEEMWRLDIERKYIRTFTGKVYDNCKLTDNQGNTKQNTRFLKEMMQGRKKYQRRQWVRDQAIYFGSKYMLNNIRNNTIEMVCYSPDAPLWNESGYEVKINSTTTYRPFEEGDFVFYNSKLYKCITANSDSTFVASKWVEGVTPDYHLKITPYQDMYINVAVGNGNLRAPQRAVAGQEYTIDCTANMNETRIYIYAGSYIQALSNLAPFYIGANIFSSAARLKKLDLGTNNDTYRNTNFKSLTILPNMSILEELNVKNCNNLNGVIDLGGSNNLKKIEAAGTMVTNVILPDYTSIETLHLPSTVNTIVLKSARALRDFSVTNKTTGLADYSNLISLNINDSDYSANINWIDIARETLSHISTLYLQGLRTSYVNNIDALDPFVTRKHELETTYDDMGNLINKLSLSGTLGVNGEWSTVERDYYGGLVTSIWPDLNFDTTNGTQLTRYKIVYKYDSTTNGGAEFYSTYVTPTQGSSTLTIPEIYDSNPTYSTVDNPPQKASTIENDYIFGTLTNTGVYKTYSGWRMVNSNGTTTPLTTSNCTINLNAIVNNTITLETIFTAQSKSYPIHWYLREGDVNPIYISNNNGTTVEIEYHQDYEGHIPTVQDIKNNGGTTSLMKTSGEYVGYRIFNGWQTTPVHLSLNEGDTAYKIYGNWISAGLDANDNVITSGANRVLLSDIYNQQNLSVEKLLLASTYSNYRTSPYLAVNDRFKVTMGYDGVAGGTTLVNTDSPYIVDENMRTMQTAVSPLSAENDAFTLVLDYKFDTNYDYTVHNEYSGLREAVLAGCYEQRNGAVYGFRLYYDITSNCVRLGFGDTLTNKNAYSKIIADDKVAQYRNVLVLRHPAGSNSLYIYSGYRYNSTVNSNNIYMTLFDELDADGFEQVLTWNNVNTDAKLILGGLLNGINQPDGAGVGIGTVYWAKYWNTDLGASECRTLAAWPHEQMEFAVEDFEGMGNRVLRPVSNRTLPNITLTAMNTSSYFGPMYYPVNNTSYTTGTKYSWINSWYEKFSNNRIFLGLPIKLQSILVKTPFQVRELSYDTNNGFLMAETFPAVEDYIFFPSYAETMHENILYKDEANLYIWQDDDNVTCYDYDTSNQKFKTTPTVSAANGKYMNLRFPYKPIGTQIRIFNGYQGTDTVYNTIGRNNIQSGDIFILASENVAYIYVTSADILAGAPVMPNSGIFACDSGGWVRSENWWMRSVCEEMQNTKFDAFLYTTYNATVTLGNAATIGIPRHANNYNNHSVEDMQTNGVGACMCYTFGV